MKDATGSVSSTSATTASSKGVKTKHKITSSIRRTQRGIWTVWDHVPSWADSFPGASIWGDLSGFLSCLPHMPSLLDDMRHLGPFVCAVYIIANVCTSILPAFRLSQSQSFLLLVEKSVATGQIDRAVFSAAITLQVVLSVLEWVTYESSSWSSSILQRRFKYHFNQRLLAVRLRLDLATSEQPDIKARLDSAGSVYGSGKTWESFEKLVGLMGLMLELVTEFGFVMKTMSNQPAGKTVMALCFMDPLLRISYYRSWYTVFWAQLTNKSYLRMENMYNFVYSNAAKLEVIGNVMSGYILKEYRDARIEFGDTSDDYPYYGREVPFAFYGFLRSIASDSAVVLLALKIMIHPEAIPLTSIAMLDQTSRALNHTVYRMINEGGSLMSALNGVKSLYEIEKIQSNMKDGSENYPGEKKGDEKGMKVEFKNVFFKYPNTEKAVINDLSFVIPQGSLCVIVGENGCGKSSTIKLLNRIYDATEGEILIDDKPIGSYVLNDIRRASAVMHQGYEHFNLTLSENIGLGYPDRAGDMEAIKEAAKLGGALDFIEKLPDGFETEMLDSEQTMSSGTIPDGSALEEMVKTRKEPRKDFSGGENQRLALSRTFMRANIESVKILAYDEPSAALDPKAEFALFDRLRNQRGGKTMLFVTHRFGYLTKYADLIIYMEEGKAIEQGSHEDLLALDGKYAQLYKVQAQAFN